ncbi:hypothetical protein J25TS5_12840 [Paenibacillus faecis]|nr:hypothetical protein J25TS5_12840 [Paenibacillus faecis]
MTIEHDLGAFDEQSVMIMAEQLTGTPGVSMGLFFGRGCDERFVHKDVKNVESVGPGKLLIVGKCMNPLSFR